jgi:hypothetical protein
MSLEIVLTDIQIQQARPEEADLRKIQHYAAIGDGPPADTEPASTLIKLYLKTPIPEDSAGVELFVGDHLIRRYSQFKNGIYFKVNDPRLLNELSGGEVRFRRPGTDGFIGTGVRLSIGDPAALKALRSMGAAPLPSQADVLRE